MQENWFFRWVWRFNALAFAVIVTLAALEFVLPMIEREMSARQQMTFAPGAPPASDAALKYRVSLDYAREGRSDAVFVLEFAPAVSEGYGSSFRPPAERRIVNYLFVDPTTGAAHWLFESHHQLITDTGYLTDAPYNDAPSSAGHGALRAVVYDVVAGGDAPTTTPGAHRTFQVFISRPDGTALTKLIDRSNEVPSTIQLDAGKIFVAYKADGHSMVASFSLTDFKPIVQQDISKYLPK